MLTAFERCKHFCQRAKYNRNNKQWSLKFWSICHLVSSCHPWLNDINMSISYQIIYKFRQVHRQLYIAKCSIRAVDFGFCWYFLWIQLICVEHRRSRLELYELDNYFSPSNCVLLLHLQSTYDWPVVDAFLEAFDKLIIDINAVNAII